MPKKVFDPLSLQIRMLGPFRIAVGGVPVAEHRWTRRKAKILVQLLALEPSHQLHRDQIIESFWPEYEPEAAANNFYKMVHLARRALEPGLSSGTKSKFIVAKGNRVALRTSGLLWIDAEEFERRAHEAIKKANIDTCEAALELYQGELLADQPYEDWAMTRRERLRILHRKLVVKLAQLYEDTNQYTRAIDRLRALADSEPTDERVHQQLMRLYALTGSKFQALDQYKQCQAALRRGLDAGPDPETVELSRQILQGLVKPLPLAKFQPSSPTFRQLTFRRGTIRSARMSSDCKVIVYSAAWEGHPFELYSTDCDGRGTQSLGITEADILSISSSNELALSLHRHFLRDFVTLGTLARGRLDRTQIGEVLEDVQWADWAPDGKALTVVRDVKGVNRLELPIGTVLYETSGWISDPRISPRGDLIAFITHPIQEDDGGAVKVVDLAGKTRTLSDGWLSAQGLDWMGDEVWFTATKIGNARALHAVTLKGETRLINRAAGCLTLLDISTDGRLLMSHDNSRIESQGLAPGEARERNLSWLDWSIACDLSDEGRLLLFTEAGEGSGSQYRVYSRNTDGSPAVHLGDGFALALSPDGKLALALSRTPKSQFVLLPIAGDEKPAVISCSGTNCQPWASWLPDGRQIVFVGNDKGCGSQLYVQDIERGSPRPITAEGVRIYSARSISPDGKLVAGIDANRKGYLYDIQGKEPIPLSGLVPGEVPIRWTNDARTLYVFCRGELPAKIHQLSISTGERSFSKELMPMDATGVHEILRVLVTPTFASHVFSYSRELSELFLVQGLN